MKTKQRAGTLVTTGEAARLLGVSAKYVSVLTKRGDLVPEAVSRNGRWEVRLYAMDDVLELVQLRRSRGRRG